MRICFVAHQSTKEGAGRYMLDQSSYLLDRGFDVCAILPSEGPLQDVLAKQGVDARIIPHQWWTRAQLRQSQPDYVRTIGAARRMAAAFRDWRIDLAYTQTIVAPAGALAAALVGIPHIWHIHEFSYNPGGIEMAIPREALARLIQTTSNAVFFNSRAVAAEWTDMLQHGTASLAYNWTTSEPDDASPEMGDKRALALLNDDSVFRVAIVGSLVRWKRQRDAVEAAIALIRENIKVALFVVGPAVDSDYAAELERLAHENGASESIRFLGYTEHPERVMRRADVTLVCSDKEPFGRVTVESMAQGTSVIGTNSGGTSEIIEHGVDGLLFPTGDVDALADALRRLAQDRELLDRLGIGARQKAKRYQDPDAAMAPVVAQINALSGQRNPAWPLGSLFDSAFAAEPAQPVSNSNTRLLPARILMALIRRVRLARLRP